MNVNYCNKISDNNELNKMVSNLEIRKNCVYIEILIKQDFLY